MDKLLDYYKERKVDDNNKLIASDYYCVKCYREGKETRAEFFWPIIDPDIKSRPYCRSCIDKLVISLILEMEKPGDNKK